MELETLEKPLLNFTALDFETANHYPGSACALGIVVVRNGDIAERRSWQKPCKHIYRLQMELSKMKDA